MVSTIIEFIRIQRVLNKIYKNEDIINNLSRLYGVPCKKDWVGRLYMVINPILQDIETDGNKLVYDINNNPAIEAWVMRNLDIIRKFVISHSMFDLMTYSITRLDDDENYLVVFKNLYFDDFKRVCLWSLGILAILIIVGIIIF